MNDFCKNYLAMQGVIILPEKRRTSRQVETREKEFVPKVDMYERD